MVPNIMQRIDAIVLHGNLTDIKYTENELGTNFNSTDSYEQPDSGMNGDFKYETNQLFGENLFKFP